MEVPFLFHISFLKMETTLLVYATDYVAACQKIFDRFPNDQVAITDLTIQ